MKEPQQLFAYFGTYANQDKEGIYITKLDTQTGTFTHIGSVTGINNPSYLALDASKHRLYAVSETRQYQEQAGGSVAAYAIDPQTGLLTFLNQQATYGSDPCYLSLDQTGSYLLVTNYSGGNVNLFPLGAQGEIEAMNSNIQYQGIGEHTERQDAPHPHMIHVDATNQFVLATDLGLDRILTYRLDTNEQRLIPYGETAAQPGAGPRHFAFHPSQRFLYVINELDSTITACTFEQEEGKPHPQQTYSTLPDNFHEENTCADIHIAPGGAFLYGSNRGHDSIVVFAIHQQTGELTYVQHISTQGKTPRNFAIAPDGRFLFVANQNSDTVVTYAIHQETGELTLTDHRLAIPRPVCIALLI